MVISNDINDFVRGPWTSQEVELRGGHLLADLEQFATGEPISMSLNHKKHRGAYFGRLDRPRDEVWVLRSQAPSPGLRLFGRFAAVDVFIALFWLPRSSDWCGRNALKDDRNYQYEIAKIRCQEEWQKLFPNHPPITGKSRHEYASDTFSV
jgi:hypothetical protein